MDVEDAQVDGERNQKGDDGPDRCVDRHLHLRQRQVAQYLFPKVIADDGQSQRV